MTCKEFHSFYASLAAAGLEFSVGSRNLRDASRQAAGWSEAGFSPDEVSEWLAAGVFTPDAASSLRRAGVTPERASERRPRHGTSWGYAVANCDADAEDVP